MRFTEASRISPSDVRSILAAHRTANHAEVPVAELTIPADLVDLRTPGVPAGPVPGIVPLVVAPADGLFEVIDGCKRLAAAKARSELRCACMVLQPSPHATARGVLRIALNQGRKLALREQLLFLTWLRQRCSKPDLRPVALELGFSDASLREGVPLLECSDLSLDLVASGVLHAPHAPDFSRLAAADQEAFARTFQGLAFSRQTQRELLEWLPEIAYRDGCSVADILTRAEVAQVLADQALTVPVRIERIRTVLFGLRFPGYSAVLEGWNRLARRVNPDPGRVSFVASPGFEKNRLEIRLVVDDVRQARDLFCRLSNIPDSDLQGLMCPIK